MAHFQVALEVDRHRTLRHALFLLPQLRTAGIGYSSLSNVALVSALGSRIEVLDMHKSTAAAVLALAAIPARTCLRHLTLSGLATDAHIQLRAPISDSGIRRPPQAEAAGAALQCTLAACTNLQELTLGVWKVDLFPAPSPGVGLQQARVRCHELCLQLHDRLAARWDRRLPDMPLGAALAPPRLPVLRRLELICCLQVGDESLVTLAAAAPHLRTLALINCGGGEDAEAPTAAGWDAGVMQMHSLRVLMIAGGSATFARAAERGAVQAGHLLLSTRGSDNYDEYGYTPVDHLEAAAAELLGGSSRLSPPVLAVLVHTWREIEDADPGDPECEHDLRALHIAAPRSGGVPLLPLLRHARMDEPWALVRLYGMHVNFNALASVCQLGQLLRLDLAGCTVDLHTLTAMLLRYPTLRDVSFSHGCQTAPFSPQSSRYLKLPLRKGQLIFPMHRNLRLDMMGLDLRGAFLGFEMADECTVLLPSHDIATKESLEMGSVLDSVLAPCSDCRDALGQPILQPLQLDEWLQLCADSHDDSHGDGGGCDGAAAADPAYTPTPLEPRDLQFPAPVVTIGLVDDMEFLSLRADVGGRHRPVEFWAQGVLHVNLNIRFAECGAFYSVWRRFPTAVHVHITVHGTAADLNCSDMHFLEELHISGECNMLRLDVRRCPHVEVDTDALVGSCFVTADGCPI